MQRIGARSVPVLSRGDKFVFAQNIAQVVAFLKLDENAEPVLSAARLVERMQVFIEAALRIIPLMPDDRLDREVPNRPRTYRALAHHMLRIPEAFVEAAGGAFFSHGLASEVARPEGIASTAALAAYGRGVRDRVTRWWRERADKSAQQTVETYYGPQKLHEVLERSTWHIAQHDRQWMMLLDMAGIAFERPLSDTDFADLPMPKKVWDD